MKANRDEYRPAGSAKVDVQVRDAHGLPASSEVTLWAVDYGVLSLTGYRTPDVLGSVYVPKALQVMNTDNRQRIISEMRTPSESWENLGVLAGSPDRIILAAFGTDALKPLTGKSLSEVAKMRGKSPEETAVDLVVECQHREPVTAGERVDDARRGAAGGHHLPTAHAAGAVQHQHQIPRTRRRT